MGEIGCHWKDVNPGRQTLAFSTNKTVSKVNLASLVEIENSNFDGAITWL